jgi:hypothetical protein
VPAEAGTKFDVKHEDARVQVAVEHDGQTALITSRGVAETWKRLGAYDKDTIILDP